jgi:eukaryotic-like serine/threonine-protein kinase
MPPTPEQRFEQYVVDRGLVSDEEIKIARRFLNQAEDEGKPITISEALIRAGCLTASQAHRVMESLKGETVMPGLSVPGVQLMEKIGRGSQAVVYRGRQISVDRVVAVKILLSKIARDPDSKRRFLQEARSAAKLSHNNIVQAIDAGESEGYTYFIMEIIDPPRTVADAIKEAGGPLPEKQALKIVIQIAEALAHAHSRGFIHRDVKPKNIMLTHEGVAKLADMGLARQVTEAGIEEAGKAFGTPYYIAPEQVLGSPDIDFRADIYSLGATFYEMVAGKPAFTAPTPQQVMQRHVTAQLTPPDHLNPKLSAGTSEVIEVMMSKRPKDRYASTSDLLVDLRSIARGEPPRIARERVGMQDSLLESLASGDRVKASDVAAGATAPAAAGHSPFKLTPLAIILLAVLAISLVINIFLALR